MDGSTVYVCASTLLIAGILELLSLRDKGLFYPKLMALGLFMLSSRLYYLLWMGDLGRLNIWGVGPIMMIAVSRVMYSVHVMRTRL